MLIFRNKSSSYYFYLLKGTCKYPGLIKKQVFFAQESLPGIKYSDKNLHKLGVSKHASNFLRSIRSWNCKLSIWSLVEILRKSQSLEQNLKSWIWSCFGRITPVIIEFICSWNIWFLRECLIFFQLFFKFFKKVRLQTLNKLKQCLYFTQWAF